MPKFNTSFDLNVHDIELIETALVHYKKELSLERLARLSSRSDETESLAGMDARLSDLHRLLGRLHNQKVFYRPSRSAPTPYISG